MPGSWINLLITYKDYTSQYRQKQGHSQGREPSPQIVFKTVLVNAFNPVKYWGGA